MNVVATVASVLLGIAFLVAGGSKVAAGPSWPIQARGLGAPSLTIPVVPWVEIAVGAALVTQIGRRGAAAIALLLLITFSALIVARLRAGEHPPCACFGAWSAKPLGAGHLVRNALLVVTAVLALL